MESCFSRDKKIFSSIIWISSASCLKIIYLEICGWPCPRHLFTRRSGNRTMARSLFRLNVFPVYAWGNRIPRKWMSVYMLLCCTQDWLYDLWAQCRMKTWSPLQLSLLSTSLSRFSSQGHSNACIKSNLCSWSLFILSPPLQISQAWCSLWHQDIRGQMQIITDTDKDSP